VYIDGFSVVQKPKAAEIENLSGTELGDPDIAQLPDV
jgi:hypothetical protein